MGYNYTFEYRPGSLNTAAYALSQQHEYLTLMGFSQPIFDSILNIQDEYGHDTEASTILTALQYSQPTQAYFSLRGDLLYYRDGIFVVESSPWHNSILQEFHFSLIGAHLGFLCTYKWVRRNFNWPGLKKAVKHFVPTCDTC